ncbi:hypothetical protein CRUP_004581 [Coryphaenoides rupestris]|nr:hypothetical protein CRUP_004581 [Coryphaenoides rupestris]
MSSEELEKLHEIYTSLYEELRLMAPRASSCHGEEKKRLQRTFDERHGEAEEVLRLHRRDLAKLQRDMASSDLGLGGGGGGGASSQQHQGIYASQNQHSTHLQSQRTLLLQGHESLASASQSIERKHLSRSRKILRAMSRRLMTNKLLLAVIILMELAILGAVVYLKFFSSPPHWLGCDHTFWKCFHIG